MSIKICIAAAVKDGRLSSEGAEEYAKLMAQAEKAANQMGRGGINAFIFSATEAAKNMVINGNNAKIATARTIMSIDRAWEEAGNHSYGRLMGLIATMGENIGGKGSANSFPAMREAALKTMESFMDQLLPKLRTDWAGLKTNTATAVNVALELRGKNTGDPIAKAGAQQYIKASEWGLKMLKQMGVPVKSLEDWHSPQRFDPMAVRGMGIMKFGNKMDEMWRAGKLELQDWETGDLAKLIPGEDDLQARTIFNKAYENITTNGATTMEPGHVEATTLTGKYGQRRVFQWANADAWHEFNTHMGFSDEGVADQLVAHIGDLARDVAMAQILGPQPEKAWPILLQMFKSEGGSEWGSKLLDSIYFHASGQSAHPVSERLALMSQSARSILTAAQLTKAVLSQISDFAFTRATASWNDLSAVRLGSDMISNIMSLAPGERQAEALRLGMGLTDGIRGLHDLTRESIADMYQRRGQGVGVDGSLSMLARMTGKTADFVLRVQGMGKLTQKVRDTLAVDFLTTHATWAGLRFEDLPKGGKNFFENYGISPAEWDVLRTQTLHSTGPGQVPMLYAARMARIGTDVEKNIALKYLGGISAEQRLGAIEGNSVVRAAMMGKSQPGSLAGEALRFGFQYKSFPVGALLMHGMRAFDSLWLNNGSQMFRGSYTAGLAVTLTALGAVGVQLDHIVMGRDPEPMSTPTFWGKASAKGGFAGIAGDWVKSAISSGSTKDWLAAGAPPAATLAGDVATYLGRNAYKAGTKGEQSHFALEGIGLLDRYSPDTIYTKLAMDRLVWDTLKRMSDPTAVRQFSTMQTRAIRDMNTRYFYPPTGNMSLPQRGPDLSRAIE